MIHHSPISPRADRGAVGCGDMLMLLLILISMIAGAKLGAEWLYRSWSWPGGFVGGVGGGIAGVAVGVILYMVIVMVAAALAWPFEAFGRWWRPYPPPCKNGTCRSGDYDIESLPPEVCERHNALSIVGWRCRCGDLYAGTHTNRWVLIRPDGTVEPVLMHRAFGRWRRDPAQILDPYIPPSELKLALIVFPIAAVIGAAMIVCSRRYSVEFLQSPGMALMMVGLWAPMVIALVMLANVNKKPPKIDSRNFDDLNAPDWIFIPAMMFLFGGIGFLFALLEIGFDKPLAKWFIAGGLLVGFITGVATVIRLRNLNRREKK